MQPKNVPMKRLQAADQLLGLAACAALQPWRAVRALGRRLRASREGRPRRAPRAVLMIKFWGLGSLQLLTPAARVLRERRPEARLTLLTLAQNAEFARGLGVFDEVLAFDVRGAGWTRLVGRILALLGSLRARRFDEVYDFEFFTRFSAVVSALTGAPLLAGFHAPSVWRGGFHDTELPFNRYWHVARNFRALAGGESGADVHEGDLVPFRIDRAVAERVDAFLDERSPGGTDAPLVVLNPNAGSLSLERRWPRDRFADLARGLIEDGLPGTQGTPTVVLIGTAAEAEVSAEVSALVGPADAPTRAHLLDLAGGLDVAELCALLARADLVVTNDSGPMHIAAALGTPTLGLFGPETPVMYRPLGETVDVLWDPPVCSPCINVHDGKRATCIHGRPECLMNLEVARVAERAHALAERGKLSVRGTPAPSSLARTAR